MEWIHTTDTQIILNVKVKRFARITGVLGEKNGWLEIGVSEPPQKGRANAALVKFLAEKLDVPKTAISIIRGKTQNQKVIRVLLRSSTPAVAEKLLRKNS